jgi:hypothetical protein
MLHSLLLIFSHRTLKLPCVQTWMVQEKLKESQYQITPWRVESSNNTSGPGQSPSHPPGNPLVASVRLYTALSFTC